MWEKSCSLRFIALWIGIMLKSGTVHRDLLHFIKKLTFLFWPLNFWKFNNWVPDFINQTIQSSIKSLNFQFILSWPKFQFIS